MKARSGSESDKALGFWARLGSALGDIDASSADLLESRIARLESEVARLIEVPRASSSATSTPIVTRSSRA